MGLHIFTVTVFVPEATKLYSLSNEDGTVLVLIYLVLWRCCYPLFILLPD
jgi:hypothetical protein